MKKNGMGNVESEGLEGGKDVGKWKSEIFPIENETSTVLPNYRTGDLPEFVYDRYKQVVTNVEGVVTESFLDLPCWPEREIREYEGLVARLKRERGFSLDVAQKKACLMVRRRFKRDSNNGKNEKPIEMWIEPKNPWNS